MQRRHLLKASLALAAYTGIPTTGLFALQAFANPADGEGQAFDFDWLKQHAKELAGQTYQPTAQKLPDTLANMTPQQFNAIGYDSQHSLWHDLKGQLDIQFFHVGMGFKTPVRMYSVDPKTHQAKEVHFRPELFTYNNSGVDQSQLKGDLGFAGFKLFKAPHLSQYDIVSFLGASYFRAVDKTRQYGLSARGLAINTYADLPEEFPDFTKFWFVTPPKNSTRFVVYALLDSPSATGAYRFDIDCLNDRVVMEVDANVNARRDVKQMGIAPMTSMFDCGTYERQTCATYHPQVHDSDRLSMWKGNGEWICRPLNNPPKLQFNAFEDESPKGFGLVQTDHEFASYQDVMVRYDRRPSLWVEPTTAWGKGAIQLLEIPTTGETLDNIVAFWAPAEPITAGKSLHFGYKLYWSALPPVSTPLARVYATRTGIGGFPEGWAPGEHWPKVWARRFALDFNGGGLSFLPEGTGIEPVVTVSSGKVQDFHVLKIDEIGGYRVLFDWYPTSDSTEPVAMRAFIRTHDRPLSETWLYQYFPPAADQRRYPDWKKS
ncbi:glucan biosynthesis protein D [Pseudomonas oryzihabitans]|uniref:glucan biosynthesis protein D n=1 Tax=Pseudomonas rhizoryzae TaxID=2571129 RepID=UPI000736554D|nr:glucan biosynthesis protein D [Pseudomonas rhizoryzae]APQ13718.1 glucan biosynthesis protein D [Pseudomonas psychrotolerans]KTS76750.1 glucan biosynthesis protein D [Pseudomonas psychrotolerans]KTT00072.1 glucan biosynthesis protein D [Pseudomonas psychrotolerans]KTT14204.1 glucan biosynthesis protein D [Pseudomonas psychrotolerans]KTT25016.1 glucan biosynthesis protein D [Pseudomonas psychrotolerans]